jgi:hypothetical protein
VTLKLTDDELYQMYTHKIDYKDYASYFKEKVRTNPAIRMHMARISVSPESFLKEMYVTNYLLADDQSLREKYQPLKKETIIALPKFLLGLSRYSDWGKRVIGVLRFQNIRPLAYALNRKRSLSNYAS